MGCGRASRPIDRTGPPESRRQVPFRCHVMKCRLPASALAALVTCSRTFPVGCGVPNRRGGRVARRRSRLGETRTRANCRALRGSGPRPDGPTDAGNTTCGGRATGRAQTWLDQQRSTAERGALPTPRAVTEEFRIRDGRSVPPAEKDQGRLTWSELSSSDSPSRSAASSASRPA
jgi:hypothetical protein